MASESGRNPAREGESFLLLKQETKPFSEYSRPLCQIRILRGKEPCLNRDRELLRSDDAGLIRGGGHQVQTG